MEHFGRNSYSVLMHAIITKVPTAYCKNNNFSFVDNKKACRMVSDQYKSNFNEAQDTSQVPLKAASSNCAPVQACTRVQKVLQ